MRKKEKPRKKNDEKNEFWDLSTLLLDGSFFIWKNTKNICVL